MSRVGLVPMEYAQSGLAIFAIDSTMSYTRVCDEFCHAPSRMLVAVVVLLPVRKLDG